MGFLEIGEDGVVFEEEGSGKEKGEFGERRRRSGGGELVETMAVGGERG